MSQFDSQFESQESASSRNTDAPAAYGIAEAEREARHRLSLIKGPERWLFRWDPGDESVLINRVAELARDPEIPFDWYDAAVVCKHVAQPFSTSGSSQ